MARHETELHRRARLAEEDQSNLVAVAACAAVMLLEDYGLRIAAMPSPWADTTLLGAIKSFPHDPAAVAFVVASEYQRSGYRAAIQRSA